MTQNLDSDSTITLPEPCLDGEMSLEACLASRTSVREYSDRALTIEEISQLLWAAQGITRDWGARTAPSAGGLFPVRVYMAISNVEDIDPGSYLYIPESHSLQPVKEGDLLQDLKAASLNQSCVGDAAVILAITAIPSITEARYGDRSMRYIDNEVGNVSQNVYLQCEVLNLGTVAVGAFNDDAISEVLGTDNLTRLIMPIGAVE